MRGRGPGQWPAPDTANASRRVALVSWLALGDTTRFRRALAALDSSLDAQRDEADAGEAIVAAEAHLVLMDTAGALARLRTFRDNTWAMTPIIGQIGIGFGQVGMLWPRTFLLLGDLAAASGSRAEAAQGYRRFIGMWDGGDAETQPLVQRARAALASLGP